MHASFPVSRSYCTLITPCLCVGSFTNLLCQSAAWYVTWQTRHRSAHRGPGKDHMVLACYLVAMIRLVQSCTTTARPATTTSTRQMLLERDHRYSQCQSCSCMLHTQTPAAASIQAVQTHTHTYIPKWCLEALQYKVCIAYFDTLSHQCTGGCYVNACSVNFTA